MIQGFSVNFWSRWFSLKANVSLGYSAYFLALASSSSLNMISNRKPRIFLVSLTFGKRKLLKLMSA